MPYKFVNFEKDLPPYDDAIEDTLNTEERDGWTVVNVHTYDSGHVKVLMHRESADTRGGRLN